MAASKPPSSPAGRASAFIEAFNALDVEGMADCFAVPSVILDGLAPHVWSGPTAPRDWCRDALAEAAHLGASDFEIVLGEPTHNTITGDAAYFVAPAAMRFKAHAQSITQHGATLTLGLSRVDNDWLIAAWTWTKGSGRGVGDLASK